MLRFDGIANASAAVALDGGHFVVADDERKYLSLYRFGCSAPVDLWKFKDRFDEHVDAEPDLEGSARIGDTIFWISSHGTDRKGRAAPDRAMLFATHPGERRDKLELEVRGTVYRGLLDDMERDPTLRKVLRFPRVRAIAPKRKGGISIEGLAATPDNGLLIGFRNPLVRGLALVVEVSNPLGLIDGEAPQFTQPLFLDLDKRGIRSMEEIDDGYLIVAGAYGTDHKPKSALFHWNGRRESKPRELLLDLPDDFNPEAVFIIPGSRTICLLSDDGRMYRGEKRRHGEPYFRAFEADLDTLLGSR